MVALAILAALTGLAGCDQDKVLYNGHNYLMFSDTLYHYAVQESNEKFEVPVSATRRADYDRTFAIEVVDKESNAVEGKHYRILSNTVTIKAGEVAANVEIEGVYENIGINDSLGFALRLIIPDVEQWHKYGTETKVVMQKACPFDIHAFTGYCKVTSTFFNTYMENTTLRLITSEIVEGEENTIVLHGLYFDGYDTKLKFNYDDILDPSIEMEEHVCGNTAELFNTFVQRSGDVEPYFTEYCDGKTVTCPGMKQWGTVDRAREGMNALQILRYYYGNRVQLVTTDNIAAIPSSYPGSPLRREIGRAHV